MVLFGTSGIRGIYGEKITLEFCARVARAAVTLTKPGDTIALARDPRVSGEPIARAVGEALKSSGNTVVDLGIVSTSTLSFLTKKLGCAMGIDITASHNPPEYNGLKFCGSEGMMFSPLEQEKVEAAFDKNALRQGKGTIKHDPDARKLHVDAVLKLAKPRRRFSVVVDPANGAASVYYSKALSLAGLDVLPINDVPDGTFPGRALEPKEETLQGTIEFMRKQGAELAVCFDGDADRVCFCDEKGFLGYNEMISFIARLKVIETGKKNIATTVETGRLLNLAVQDIDGIVLNGLVGDPFVARAMQDKDCAIGVEQVGVYIMPEMGLYPETLYPVLYLLSKIGDVSEIRAFFKKLPRLHYIKQGVDVPEDKKYAIVKRLVKRAREFGAESVNNADGLRFEYKDSWMLIRASGTQPLVRVIVESSDEKEYKRLLDKGVQLVKETLEGME